MGFTALYMAGQDNALVQSNTKEPIMKRHRIPAVFLGLAALAAGCSSTAQQMPAQPGSGDRGPMAMEHGPGGHGGREGHEQRGPGLHGQGMPFLHGVQLSEAQQDRVFAIMHAQAPAQRDVEKQIRAAHEAMRSLGASGQFDEAKASAVARSLGEAVAAEALLHARTHAQVLAVLTPEQREQAARGRAQRQARQ
jgi:Spy/CpxP family protein refolding chaperone